MVHFTEISSTELATIDRKTKETTLSTSTVLLEILRVASSTVLYNIIIVFQGNICTALVSNKFNNLDLIESVGLVSSIYNFMLCPVINGIIGGFASLGSSAHSAKNYKLLSAYYFRTLIVGFLAVTILYAIAILCAPMLLALLTTNENVRQQAYTYMMYSFGYGYFDVFCLLNIIYLNIVDKIFWGNIIGLISCAVFPLIGTIFISINGFGLVGAGLAILAGNIFAALLFYLYIFVVKPDPDVDFEFTWDSFKGIPSYLKFTLPVVLLICCMNWGFELQSYFALRLGDYEYSVFTMCQNFGSYLYIFSEAFSESSVIIVGKLVAKGEVKNAKRTINLSLIFGNILFFILIVLFSVLSYPLMRGMTRKPKLLDDSAAFLPIFCFLCLPFFTLFNLVDTLRALNRQTTAFIIYALNGYLLQVFLSWLFSDYLNMHLRGIGLSMFLGFTIGGVVFKFYIDSLDFRQVRKEIIINMLEDKKEIEKFEMEMNDDEMEQISKENI